MFKILVSACLMGEMVRYDGSDNLVEHQLLNDWKVQGRLLNFCPEFAAGLGVPRAPAEIDHGNGSRVINQQSLVVDINGQDVTQEFILGAQKTLELAITEQVKIAILKDNSPSCGSSYIYDGSYSGLKIRGQGVTTALLEQHGIHVFSENGIQAANQYLQFLESL